MDGMIPSPPRPAGCLLLFLAASSSPASADGLADRYGGLIAEVRSALEPVATRYEAAGHPQEAVRIRGLLTPPDLRTLPLSWPGPLGLPAVESVPAALQTLYGAEAETRRAIAADIYRVSREALRKRRPVDAFRLAHWVLAVDPDHEKSREALGQSRTADGWQSDFLAEQAKQDRVWDRRFGWLPRDWVARYEAGERYVGGRWLTAEAEATIRSNFRSAWSVETEHFRLRTNESLETAVRLASRLEDFRTYFVRQYPTLFDSPRRASSLWGRQGGRPARPMQVQVFATRGEYVATLSAKQPNVGFSNGVYLPVDRVSYFFVEGNDDLEGTLFHEVSHQLLYESGRRRDDVGEARGYWAVEGFACYLETFDTDGVTADAGDPLKGRIAHAAQLAADGEIPAALSAFDALGKAAFITAADMDDLVNRYAHATGLTHFFLNAKDGRYRQAFLTYLRRLYEPGGRPVPLADLVGVPADVLDAEYRSYITDLPVDYFRGAAAEPSPSAGPPMDAPPTGGSGVPGGPERR